MIVPSILLQQQAMMAQQTAGNTLWIRTTNTATSASVLPGAITYMTGTTTASGISGGVFGQQDVVREIVRSRIAPGEKVDIELPDGAMLKVAADGSYRIEDKDAKITYRANRVREFNRFINASDLLVKFIGYLNTLRLNQKEALGLPIDLFIAWLIIEAAKADDEEPQEAELAKLETLMRKHVQIDPPKPMLALPPPMPRCFCGRFMARARAAKGLMFCGGAHMDRYEAVYLATCLRASPLDSL